MTKEQILVIATEIINEENVVAQHGTSIANAKSIMESGLNGNRTTYVVCKPDTSPIKVAIYGWKENAPGDAANVIISIPSSFYSKLLGYTKEEVATWLKDARQNIGETALIMSIADMRTEVSNFPLMNVSFNIPKEFIKGMFVYQNNTNYLSFLNNEEAALENLVYYSNSNYFDNLSIEEQEIFVQNMQNKLGIKQSQSR